ncbi:tandem five-transmembrane protein [Terribacillus saccharophilus]|uniref:Tandem five-transmembrane protein n=1 Tax=Terribacillus saccharophilus TaxID=361277 RepID=A0AAX2EGW4_9BACI|nr:tandem five-transmembrane protein [Terribacillus saccharophilus]
MNAQANFVYKKMRYNLITINNDYYILDKDNPKWLIYIPFLFWFFPHKAYKITNQDILNDVVKRSPKEKGSYVNILAIVIGLAIANLLRPIMNRFDVNISTPLSLLIIGITTLLILLLRSHISRRNKENLLHHIDGADVEDTRLIVRFRDLKFLVGYILYYIFILAFVIGMFYAYVSYGNTIILVFYMITLFLLTMGNLFTVWPGNIKVKFQTEN